MKERIKKNHLFQLLGISFLAQAIIPLIVGLVFKSFESEDMSITMNNITNNILTVNLTIIFWFIAAIFVIVLGIAMYLLAGHVNKTMGIIALCLYLVEAMLVLVGQTFVFGLLQASQLYIAGGDAELLNLGRILLSCRHFAGEMAMIPFGIGAILFFYLLMKEEIIPKWLALYGLITAPLIMIGIPLTTFGVVVPIAVFAPYIPFEFFTGIYILVKYWKKPIL